MLLCLISFSSCRTHNSKDVLLETPFRSSELIHKVLGSNLVGQEGSNSHLNEKYETTNEVIHIQYRWKNDQKKE